MKHMYACHTYVDITNKSGQNQPDIMHLLDLVMSNAMFHNRPSINPALRPVLLGIHLFSSKHHTTRPDLTSKQVIRTTSTRLYLNNNESPHLLSLPRLPLNPHL